jgi:hypothetical protein
VKSHQTGHPDVMPLFVSGDSRDGHAHGGHDYPQPPIVNRRVQVLATDNPATDRWVSLTTVRTPRGIAYRVQVLDSRNRPHTMPADYPTLPSARTAANNLYRRLTKETE